MKVWTGVGVERTLVPLSSDQCNQYTIGMELDSSNEQTNRVSIHPQNVIVCINEISTTNTLGHVSFMHFNFIKRMRAIVSKICSKSRGSKIAGSFSSESWGPYFWDIW